MVADLGNPLYPELMGPVHAALEQYGYRLVLFAEDENMDEAVAYDRLFDQSIDGVILTTTRLNSTLPTALTRRQIPYVMLNRTVPGAEAVSCVADNVGGARRVGERLLAPATGGSPPCWVPTRPRPVAIGSAGSARPWPRPGWRCPSGTSGGTGSPTPPGTRA